MRRRRTALVISLSVILLLGIAVGVAALSGWGPFGDGDPDPTSSPTATASATATETTGTTAPPAPSPSPTATATQTAPAETTGPSAEPTDDPVDPTTPPGTDTASVLITYASWEDSSSSVEVGAYAALVEPAATCTLTLTQGSITRTQTIDALTDVSTMSCGGFQVARSELTPGTWTAVVTYGSATSSGTSAPVEVTVP